MRYAMILMLLVGGCLSHKRDATVHHDPMVVDMDAMLTAYDANPVRADSRYRGMTIQTSGRVLQLAADAVVLVADAPGAMQCDLHGDVRNLSKGQTVTVIGRVVGMGHMADCELK